MAGALTKVGRYQIVDELGRGSMGVVYKGFDPVIGRTIAIKTMLTEGLSAAEFQEYKARFQREAQAAGVLSHPNIVTVYDFGEENGTLYLAMECLSGESLEKIVETRNILPLEDIIPLYEQICSALDHAHLHKVVHRDIKPANIMILSDGKVKVTDFGIAKMMAAGMTQAGQILGTPNYMSPEQVKGRPVDGRCDIFSLGVILYELVTGEKPFGGQNITTVIYKIINENPIAPRELDAAIHPGLSYVTSKALAKSPEDRYQSCRELAEDLRNYKNLGATPGATVVMKTPSLASEPAVERPAQHPLPPPTAEPRPLSVQVIPPAGQPQAGGGSIVAWALLVLLVLGGAGTGAYFYFVGNPWKASVPPVLKPPPPIAKVGGLIITANVPEARISVDGRSDPGWTTPHTFSDLTAGSHVVVISKDGYDNIEQPVTVQEGQTNPLNLELAAKKVEPTPEETVQKTAQKLKPSVPKLPPAPKLGQLVVTANVDGARIALDNRGQPDWVAPYTFSEVPAGSHTLTLSKDGYDTEYRTVTVAGGRTTPLNVELRVPSGEINIVTIPAGADVTIDGKAMGTSPLRATVSAGRHTYTAKLPGRPASEGIITVAKGMSVKKSVDWSGGATAPSGIVEVRTIPPGASVAGDGAPLGERTPANFRLNAGRHTLTLSLPGYATVEREVDVPADDSTPVKVYVTLSHP